MCSIFGSIVTYGNSARPEISTLINALIRASIQRGRDGLGFRIFGIRNETVKRISHQTVSGYESYDFASQKFLSMIGNTRAEPTTEYVHTKSMNDQQPYRCGKWTIVHNGTIANDAQLRTHEVDTNIDSAAIAELLDESFQSPPALRHFTQTIRKLQGSYAILAVHEDQPENIYAACNYRPIWFQQMDGRCFISSAEEFLPDQSVATLLEPYSTAIFNKHGVEAVHPRSLYNQPINKKALVVCSGGMDSVVAATKLQKDGYDIELLHFQYGCRAQGPEVEAVNKVAKALGCPVSFMPLPIYRPSDSPLLREDSAIAGGEQGAEFAHEWVPARNLVMLSIATAIAEARGFSYIGLGNNMEEAGAYPDNEPEFINRLNTVMPYAVGSGKQVRIVMPVGNLMKHEIVKLGEEIGAPMHLTWSCYRAGHKHCGKCGPCFMRKTAYEINKRRDPLEYEA